jgi:fermentation-respiration switch protein FrsA (DUF1100 family)
MVHIVKQEYFSEKLPVVFFIHGFTSAKEHNLHYAYYLAEKGFRVVLPEALYHGERTIGLNEHQLSVRFWEIVLTTIDELHTIKEYFEAEQLIDSKRIGLAGTSMGGIVTLGALTKYDWIQSAVSLMGMPYYEKFALAQLADLEKQGGMLSISEEELAQLLSTLRGLDLSIQPEKLDQRPLLFWHGKKDTVVPFSYTYEFYHKIKPIYRGAPERLCFISDEHAGHKVSREGVEKTVEWFERYLMQLAVK